jgi:hypothetical protein
MLMGGLAMTRRFPLRPAASAISLSLCPAQAAPAAGPVILVAPEQHIRVIAREFRPRLGRNYGQTGPVRRHESHATAAVLRRRLILDGQNIAPALLPAKPK